VFPNLESWETSEKTRRGVILQTMCEISEKMGTGISNV
jgi:hypothetical protein